MPNWTLCNSFYLGKGWKVEHFCTLSYSKFARLIMLRIFWASWRHKRASKSLWKTKDVCLGDPNFCNVKRDLQLQIHSSYDCKVPGGAKPKPVSSNLIQLSHMKGSGLSTRMIFSTTFPKPLSVSWIISGISGAWTRDASISGCSFTYSAKMLTPKLIIS